MNRDTVYRPGESRIVDDALARCLDVAFATIYEALTPELVAAHPGDRLGRLEDIAEGVRLAVDERVAAIRHEEDAFASGYRPWRTSKGVPADA